MSYYCKVIKRKNFYDDIQQSYYILGSALMNEAALTGESVPQSKVSLNVDEQNQVCFYDSSYTFYEMRVYLSVRDS